MVRLKGVKKCDRLTRQANLLSHRKADQWGMTRVWIATIDTQSSPPLEGICNAQPLSRRLEMLTRKNVDADSQRGRRHPDFESEEL